MFKVLAVADAFRKIGIGNELVTALTIFSPRKEELEHAELYDAGIYRHPFRKAQRQQPQLQTVDVGEVRVMMPVEVVAAIHFNHEAFEHDGREQGLPELRTVALVEFEVDAESATSYRMSLSLNVSRVSL